MAVVSYPEFLQTRTYDAQDLRMLVDQMQFGEGVMGRDDFRVIQRVAGANMSVDIEPGDVFVRGDDVARQGFYRVVNDARANLAIAAAHATLPRLDQIVARVYDSSVTGSSDIPALESIAGTATGGATLDNRTGAASLPAGACLLADVLVAAADTSITTAEIRTRRPFAVPLVPPLLTDVDMVTMQATGQAIQFNTVMSHALHDLMQSAALFTLPRRIVGATRVRWRYHQDSPAAAGNWVIGIADASGRLIVNTGSVAFTGANSSYQEVSAAIAATTLEAGPYYVFLGLDTTAGQAYSAGITMIQGAGQAPGFARNLGLRSASGGVTVPATILGLTDLAGITADTQVPPVPQIALSVG